MATRRAFVRGAVLAAGAGLVGLRPPAAAAEPPPETTTIRLMHQPLAGSSPQQIIAQGTDWRILAELKKELKG